MKRVGVICLATLLAAVLLFAACAPEVTPQEPEEAIKIGIIADLTGPYAHTVSEIYAYVTIFWRYQNEQGGIDGIPVKWFWADTGSSPPRILSAYRKFKEEGAVAVHSFTSADGYALLSFANADKIPLVGHASATKLLNPPAYNFAVTVNGAQTMVTAANWFLDRWKEKEMGRPMRLATIGWDNAYAREGLEPLVPWAEEHGVEFVGAYWVSAMALDYTVPLTALKAKEPDVIAAIGSGGIVCRDAARVGLPEDTPIFCCLGSVETRGQVALAGAEVARAYAVIPFDPYSEAKDRLIFKLMMDLHQQYLGEEVHEITADNCAGWNQGSVLYYGIKNALDEVGYENLTGEAIARGIESIRDVDLGYGYISYGDYPGDRIASEVLKLWKFDLADNWWVSASDWLPRVSFPEILDKYVK